MTMYDDANKIVNGCIGSTAGSDILSGVVEMLLDALDRGKREIVHEELGKLKPGAQRNQVVQALVNAMHRMNALDDERNERWKALIERLSASIDD